MWYANSNSTITPPLFLLTLAVCESSQVPRLLRMAAQPSSTARLGPSTSLRPSCRHPRVARLHPSLRQPSFSCRCAMCKSSPRHPERSLLHSLLCTTLLHRLRKHCVQLTSYHLWLFAQHWYDAVGLWMQAGGSHTSTSVPDLWFCRCCGADAFAGCGFYVRW